MVRSVRHQEVHKIQMMYREFIILAISMCQDMVGVVIIRFRTCKQVNIYLILRTHRHQINNYIIYTMIK